MPIAFWFPNENAIFRVNSRVLIFKIRIPDNWRSAAVTF